MAGPGGVPPRHAVAVEMAVVLLQLLQGVKGHKAIVTFLLNTQKVVLPAMMSQGERVQLHRISVPTQGLLIEQ